MEIKVSVICCVFNHERYLRKTLDGFINQKTNYPFEVIIHDDKSTDSSKKIIEEYVRNYPKLFVPIYENENQYSKGIDIIFDIMLPKAHGEYIALCEGDDYWNDENKIQDQIDYLEMHHTCSMCVHNTVKIKETGETLGKYFNHDNCDRYYSAEEIIYANGGGLFHTSSFMLRKSCLVLKPKNFDIKGIGDFTVAIWMATQGEVFYIDKVMSAYRVGSVNCWEKRIINNNNFDIRKNHYLNVIDGIREMNSITEYQYNDAFNYIITKSNFEIDVLDRRILSIMKNNQYKKVFKKYKGLAKLKLYLRVVATYFKLC